MKITARSIGYRRIMLNLKPATHRAWDDFRVHVSEVINFPLYMYSSVKKSFSCLSLGLIFLSGEICIDLWTCTNTYKR